MTYLFSGTPVEMMSACLRHLERAKTGGPNADPEFRQALICLVGLSDRQAYVGAPDPQQLREFWQNFCEALLTFGNKVAAYILKAIFLAEGANEDEWYELCMRRTVIQLLISNCSETAISNQIDLADVADLDVELLKVGKEQGPIPEPFIPKGLPDSYWWWHYPDPSEESSDLT